MSRISTEAGTVCYLGALLIVMATMPAPLQAEGLERLFTTPKERARLELSRHRSGAIIHQDTSSAAVSNVPRLKINGAMTGSDGRRVLWVNGKVNASGSARLSAGTKINLAKNGRVAVQLKNQRKTIQLKAGQMLELGSGKIHEGYEKPNNSRSRAEPDVVKGLDVVK